MGGANPPRRAPCSVFLHESGRYPRTGYRSTTGRSHGPPQPAEVRPRWANCGRRTRRHARQPCRTASRSRPGYRAAAARPVRGPALPGPKPERRCRSSRGDFLVSAEDRTGVASLVTTCFGPRTAAARFTGRTCDELSRRRRRRDRGARAVWLDQPPHGRSAPAPSRSPRSAPRAAPVPRRRAAGGRGPGAPPRVHRIHGHRTRRLEHPPASAGDSPAEPEHLGRDELEHLAVPGRLEQRLVEREPLRGDHP